MDAARPRVDADKFLSMLPADVPRPRVVDGGDDGLVMDWGRGDRKAVAYFDGDGMFGFTLYKGGRYVPGAEDGDISRPETLDELIAYLRGETP